MKELNASKVRAYNHRLATEQARRIAAAWGMPQDAPAGLHGSLAAVRLPDFLQRRDPRQLMAELLARERVVVPVMPIDGVLWARVSAQVYNVPADYDRLARLDAATL